MAQVEEETRSRSAIVIKPGGRYVGEDMSDDTYPHHRSVCKKFLYAANTQCVALQLVKGFTIDQVGCEARIKGKHQASTASLSAGF